MPAYLVGIIGFLIGVGFLTLVLITWWIVKAITEFRKTVDDVSESIAEFSRTIAPLMADPRVDDYGKALQALAMSIPVITAQLKALTGIVGQFYGMAVANAGTQEIPTPKPAAPNPDASDSNFYAYDEMTAAALEKRAEAQRRGIVIPEEGPGTTHPGASAEV